jgi:hypothetical protein
MNMVIGEPNDEMVGYPLKLGPLFLFATNIHYKTDAYWNKKIFAPLRLCGNFLCLLLLPSDRVRT